MESLNVGVADLAAFWSAGFPPGDLACPQWIWLLASPYGQVNMWEFHEMPISRPGPLSKESQTWVSAAPLEPLTTRANGTESCSKTAQASTLQLNLEILLVKSGGV